MVSPCGVEGRSICERLSGLTGIAGGFLLGMIVNALSGPVNNSPDLLNWLFFDVRSRLLPTLLSWLAVVILLFLSLGRRLLSWYARTRSYDVRLAELYHNSVDPFLQPFQRGRIAWGLGLTMQSCPDLHAGWLAGDVRIEHDTTKYELPPELESAYREYVDTVFSKKYTEDRTRLMLIENPRAFSDARPLRLRVKETKYSQVQFYHTWIRRESNQRAQHIDEIIRGTIAYPNSLCLHLVVTPADAYLLVTQTSPKNGYYPNQWSSSIGEQLDLSDLQGPEERFALNWVERALWEELGVSPDGFLPDNARIMAVFLEGDIANCALAAIVTLRHHRADLLLSISTHALIMSSRLGTSSLGGMFHLNYSGRQDSITQQQG